MKKTYQPFPDIISKIYNVSVENGVSQVSIQLTEACNLCCSYCVTGDTLITMSDFTHKPIKDIVEGDEIIAFDEYPNKLHEHNRVRKTTVTHTFKRTTDEYYKVTFENGAVLNITGNHKVLSRRNSYDNRYDFKPVKNLKVNDSVFDYDILNFDYSDISDINSENYMLGYIVGAVMGDGCLKDYSNESRKQFFFRFAVNDEEITERLASYLDYYKIHFNRSPFNNQSYGKTNIVTQLITTQEATFKQLTEIINNNFEKNQSMDYMCGFLASIYDTEGSFSCNTIRIANTNIRIVEEIMRCLRSLDISCVLERRDDNRINSMYTVRITNGINAKYKFVLSVKPACERKGCCHFIESSKMRKKKVVNIEKINAEIEVFNLETESHTYFANSMAVHNCYQINKSPNRMSRETAKEFIDYLFSDEFQKNNQTYGICIDFIGGEPFLEIDLMEQISEYFINQCLMRGHRWINHTMFNITTNGLLYFDERVQAYLQKYRAFISLTITIDGCKELHDACRVDSAGNGSYDKAITALRHYRDNYTKNISSKLTLAPQNIDYLLDAVKNFVQEEYPEINLNCVFEDVWSLSDATKYYYKLKEVADYLLSIDWVENPHNKISVFDQFKYNPLPLDNNDNACGGNCRMVAVNYSGKIYPCIRYMESSLGKDVKPIIIGDIKSKPIKTKEYIENFDNLHSITRASQSTDECMNCSISTGCGWCSAYNYQYFGEINKRCTSICYMHHAEALANVYFWNKYFLKNNQPYFFHNYATIEKSMKIIPIEEYEMLCGLEKECLNQDFEEMIPVNYSQLDNETQNWVIDYETTYN